MVSGENDYEEAAAKLPFMTEEVRQEFKPDQVVELSPMVRRITAANPSMMTGPGTNTFIIGNDRLTVIDPGPALVEHTEAIVDYCDGRLEQILLTHTHPDHSPGAALLQQITGASVKASPVQLTRIYDETFTLNQPLEDGDRLDLDEYSIEVVHTPGHVANHLCFLLKDCHWLFAGDMVMDGSTVVIAPPDGHMGEYLKSLHRLVDMPIEAIAPAHGRIMDSPASYLQSLIEHRLRREQKVIDSLVTVGAATINELLPSVYDDVPVVLHSVAAMSLEAHLIKLADDKRVNRSDDRVRWSLKN
ncbi:MAG: MBL fold metallo-hydrolase [Immundisolibacteraceae bacterium]|nr:MBL fold metallo-hydrolase [Immundisolibacteraceae bacterium]